MPLSVDNPEFTKWGFRPIIKVCNKQFEKQLLADNGIWFASGSIVNLVVLEYSDSFVSRKNGKNDCVPDCKYDFIKTDLAFGETTPPLEALAQQSQQAYLIELWGKDQTFGPFHNKLSGWF